MAQILEKEGLKTQLLDLKHTKQKAWPPSASFDGILVGSGMKMFRWVGEATTSLKNARGRAQSAQSEGARVNDL
jgi:menaquinone-dependent protoporphyrinogen IX oxidase